MLRMCLSFEEEGACNFDLGWDRVPGLLIGAHWCSARCCEEAEGV